MVNSDGSLGEKNSLSCGSIEHKIGIKGTNGIQALDLLGRKILGDKGKALNDFLTEIRALSA